MIELQDIAVDTARWKAIGERLDGLELELATRYRQIALLRTENTKYQLDQDIPPSLLSPGFEPQYRDYLRPIWWRAWRLGRETAQEEVGALTYQESPWDPDTTQAIEEKILAQRIKLESATTRRKIREIVKTGINEGKTMDEIKQEIVDKVGLNEARAYRIARTETTTAFNIGRWETFLEADVRYVKILNVLDFRTCGFCQEMHGKVMEMSTLEGGYLPPFHPHCRCTITPASGEEIPKRWNARLERYEVAPEYRLLPPPLEEKGFGYIGGAKTTQVEIEDSIPPLREAREKLISQMSFDPRLPNYEQLAETMNRHLRKILADHVSLSHLRLLDEIRAMDVPSVYFGIFSPGEVSGTMRCSGFFAPRLDVKGEKRRVVAIQTNLADRIPLAQVDVLSHELFHCFDDAAALLNPTLKLQAVAIYQNAARELQLLAREIQPYLSPLHNMALRDIQDNPPILYEFLAHTIRYAPAQRRRELRERLVSIAPSSYAMTAPYEYFACWAAELVTGAYRPAIPGTLLYIGRVYGI